MTIRPTMCSRCSCMWVLWQLVKYHKWEQLNEIETLSVREILEWRGEYIENGKTELFSCYTDKEEVKCRGLKIAFDYIDKHNLVWK